MKRAMAELELVAPQPDFSEIAKGNSISDTLDVTPDAQRP